MSYVQARKSGRVEYRRAFPKELRPYVGATELVRSLKAKSVTDPAAVELFRAANDEFDRRVALARKAANGEFDELNGPTIAFLAEALYVDLLETDEARRWATGDEWEARWAEKTVETLDHVMPHYRHLQAMGDLDGLLKTWTEEAGYIAEAHGYRFDPNDDRFQHLCRALNEAAIRAGDAKLQRLDGDIIGTPAPPAKPVAAQATANGADGDGFIEMARKALERPALALSPTTKQATRTALRLFEDVHGNLPVRAVTPAHVARLIDLLLACPAKRCHRERQWPLPKLVEAYDGKHVKRLSGKTVAQHVGMLSAIWRKLRKAGDIDRSAQNPFAEHDIPKPRRKENPGLTTAELEAMFALSVFTRGERPKGGKGEATYWIPLFLLWTGARPEEIAQLLLTDFYRDEEAGEWRVRITDEGEHPHKGPRTLKTARTGSGQRDIPVPRPLIELGLVRYLEWLRKDGQEALFPALRTKGERKELYAGFGEWWSKQLRKHQVLPPGKRPARELRHTWSTAAIAAGVPEEAREYIMGHKDGRRSLNRNYGERKALGQELHRVKFEADLSGVLPWVAPSQ